MATLQSLRKAYGVLKDTTTVSLAKVNSEYKDLDIAIVKASNHVEQPPKERHIRKIFIATSSSRPRPDVAYCVQALARRLAKTRDWVVALKTLIVIHRTLRESDPIFREELLYFSHKAHALQISNFKDDSSPLAWDCSAWVRTYALFLEERLECFRILRYDIEAEKLRSDGSGQAYSRTRNLGSQELLEQLPALQQLLFRLLGCQPEGAAFGNYLIQYALALVVKESFKIYCAINDGIINLVDLFFDMSRHDALKSFDIYNRAGRLAENLAKFYELCKGLELARNFKFPTLKEPPPSFIPTMEEYIREAPRSGSFSDKRVEYKQKNLLTYKQEISSSPEKLKLVVEEPKPIEGEPQTVEEEPKPIESEDNPQPVAEPTTEFVPQSTTTGDLLGLDQISPMATELENSNALALAIIPSEGDARKSASTSDFLSDPSGWELALVTASTSNSNLLNESKLAGGFDKFLLDSLYDDGKQRQQNTATVGNGSAANHFNSMDPFAMSNNVPPPPSVQMAMMTQQQQQNYYAQQQQSMGMMPQAHQPYYAQLQGGSSNPFGNPFVAFPQPAPLQSSSSLI